MTSQQLHHAIAQATGEDIAVIRRLGFQISPNRMMLDDIDEEFESAPVRQRSARSFDLDSDEADRRG